MTTEKVELAPNNQPQIEIPRDRRGRLRWKLLTPTDRIVVIRQEARLFYQQEGEIKQSLLSTRKKYSLQVAIGRFYPGGLTQLQIDLGLDPSKKVNGYWQDPENILAEVTLFLSKYGTISGPALRRNRYTSLKTAISKDYPGGWPQLRKDLELPEIKKAKNFWNQDTIEQEARRFLLQHGELTSTSLLTAGRNDLSIAISRKFPGTWPALHARLGLQPPQKETGFWTKKKIEQEAREFYMQHEKLSTVYLTKKDKGDLAAAITHHYPGEVSGLKRKLGIPIRSTRKHTNEFRERGYWQSPENIEREARELVKAGGALSWESSFKYGKTTLLNAAGKYYPGGITALKEKLGIQNLRGQAQISPEQANEQLRRLLETK